MTPFAIISDVHSNLEAMKAVLNSIKRRGINDVLFLGDAVGYGPDPDECITLLKKTCTIHVMGNHDSATLDPHLLDYFNEYARQAILWTRENISDKGIEYLTTMKMKSGMKRENICLVHSTPQKPEAWDYLYNLDDIERNIHHFDEQICFVGHSHVPFIAERSPSGEIELFRGNRPIRASHKYLVNVGSVGQPRDGDPRACYVVFQDNAVTIVRIKYAIEKTQEKMLKAELPAPLIERLSRGV